MLYNIAQQLCKVYFGYNFHGVLLSPRSRIICQRKILSEKPETLMALEQKTAENDPAALSKLSYMPRRPTRAMLIKTDNPPTILTRTDKHFCIKLHCIQFFLIKTDKRTTLIV